MSLRRKIDTRLPEPARSALALVQSTLSVQRKKATELIHSGAVICDGRVVKQLHVILPAGGMLEIEVPANPTLPNHRSVVAPTSRRTLEVLYEDESVILVDKTAGILTVPTPKGEKATLLHQIRKHLSIAQASRDWQRDELPWVGCVQRLDREVSGVLVFAKTQQAYDSLREQFSRHEPKRQYLAVVQGKPRQNEGEIRSNLITDKHLKRRSVAQCEGGESAITRFKVVETWRDVSLVELELETGRRNQIRVHMADMGHPILGDTRYRRWEASHPMWPFERVALHAARIEFKHPETLQSIHFQTSWPEEFRELRRHQLPRVTQKTPNKKRR